MKAILEICCGLDVHRDNIVATIMKGSLDCEPITDTRTFPAFQDGLKKLKAWLEEENCRHVAMESTSIYWKPIYTILEDSFDGNIKVMLVNAQSIKNVPGRKTDVKDSEWIASLLRAGLLSGSFIPDKDIRELRDLTRYRKNMVHEVSTQKNRIEKFLQSNGFKLSTFISDVFGASGRLIIEHLIQNGKISTEELEKSIKGTLRNKKNEIALAVNGELNSHGKNFLSMQMRHLKQIETNVEEMNKIIDEYLKKFEQQATLIEGIPGISEVSAAAIIAEIGTDMSHFADAQKICSWAGVSPGCNESAGKKNCKDQTRKPLHKRYFV